VAHLTPQSLLKHQRLVVLSRANGAEAQVNSTARGCFGRRTLHRRHARLCGYCRRNSIFGAARVKNVSSLLLRYAERSAFQLAIEELGIPLSAIRTRIAQTRLQVCNASCPVTKGSAAGAIGAACGSRARGGRWRVCVPDARW